MVEIVLLWVGWYGAENVRKFEYDSSFVSIRPHWRNNRYRVQFNGDSLTDSRYWEELLLWGQWDTFDEFYRYEWSKWVDYNQPNYCS